jgi:hypothetical protein
MGQDRRHDRASAPHGVKPRLPGGNDESEDPCGCAGICLPIRCIALPTKEYWNCDFQPAKIAARDGRPTERG